MKLPYTYRFDKIDDNNMYIGKATAGSSETSPVWRIALWSDNGSGQTSAKWAGGDAGWNYSWADRASLSYS